MADERHEYEVLVNIDEPGMDRVAYRPGQPIHAQVVQDWGLTVGEAGDDEAQVMSLRPRELARPASNASRDEWFAYRASQPGADRAALDDMGRNALRDMDRDPDAPDERDGKAPAEEPADKEEG